MANFCCSIELEPRTLKQGQLGQAREVAVGIIQNNEPNEASNMFVEGLKPVAAAVKEMAVMVVRRTDKLENEEHYSKDDETCNVNNGTAPTPCQCSRNSPSPTIIDSPHHSKFKEPLSAPF